MGVDLFAAEGGYFSLTSGSRPKPQVAVNLRAAFFLFSMSGDAVHENRCIGGRTICEQ
jgi:hypothetical protein